MGTVTSEPVIGFAQRSEERTRVMGILFVNACLRGDGSRTLELCRAYLEGLPDVTEVNLDRLRLQPLYKDEVERRAKLEAAGEYDDPIFALAKQLAAADEVVIGAPDWDLSFPAALKVYIEHVSVMDVTFHYTEDSLCEGLCRARHITYITTCGGKVGGANLGYDYVCGIARMFGIPEVRFAAAEDLDVVGVDIQARLAHAKEDVLRLKAQR